VKTNPEVNNTVSTKGLQRVDTATKRHGDWSKHQFQQPFKKSPIHLSKPSQSLHEIIVSADN
jgi:hypothetical protein